METMILDCTLRDGGYINNWKFGNSCIRNTIQKLGEANIDIIECGFLRDIVYDEEVSIFSSLEQLAAVIGEKKKSSLYVAMIAIGDIPIEKIAPARADSIDGIRITFHEHEQDITFEAAQALMDKGYKVFIQPVGTSTYTDKALYELVERVNALHPYAFYIVDTLGCMYQDDLMYTFQLIDKNLDPDIVCGYHSHNNLQLAFANAQALTKISSNRKMILDSSVFGMGRGAGNLCTELMADFINKKVGPRYDLVPILEIFDEYLQDAVIDVSWGYKLPYFLAAVKGCHPNYADNLLGKKTLSIKAINIILDRIPQESRALYDTSVITDLYFQYQTRAIDDSEAIALLKESLSGKTVLILGPGPSILSKQKEIHTFIDQHHPVVISVNYVPDEYTVDMMFISNAKRFKSVYKQKGKVAHKVISTSNLPQLLGEENYQINYGNYITYDAEGDNAGVMLCRLLISLGVEAIYLAGFDGFSIADNASNFYNSESTFSEQKKAYDEKNQNIKKQFDSLQAEFPLTFLTRSSYSDGN